MPPIYLTPAQPSGSTYPHYGAMVRDRASHAGVVIPQLAQQLQDQLPPAITRPTTRRGMTMQHSSPPASLSSVEAAIPKSSFPAEIIKPLTLTPSVAGTVYNATPLSNITNVVNDLRHAKGRPVIPLGLRDRAADAMPPGMRQRAAAWSRALARWRSTRPSRGNAVGRE